MKPNASLRDKDCYNVKALDFAIYDIYDNEWVYVLIQIDLDWIRKNGGNSYYIDISSKIKNSCDFFDIKKDDEFGNVSVYDCSGIKLGFTEKENAGYIIRY